MRRIGSVLFALALAGIAAGCSSKNNSFTPPSGTTSGTSTTSSSGSGSSGSTGVSSSGSGSSSGSSGSGGSIDAGACSNANTQLEFKNAPTSLSLTGANGPATAALTVHAFVIQNGVYVDQSGCQILVAESANDTTQLVAFDKQNLLTGDQGTDVSNVSPSGRSAGAATVIARLVGGAATASVSTTINVNSIPDGGQSACGDLTGAKIILDSPAAPITMAPGQSVDLTFHAVDASGAAIPGCSLAFTATAGLHFTSVSTSTDQLGNFSATISAGSSQGAESFTVTMSGVTLTVNVTVANPPDGGTPVVDAGSPNPTQLQYVSGTPADHLLNVLGSGTDNGNMIFQVLDQYGQPSAGTTVDFAVVGSPLITITNATAITGNDGKAIVFFAAGKQPGATTLQASLPGTGVTNSQPVSVHSGKPSWKNFQFYCEDLNLPIYSLSSNTLTTTCHVQLGDRWGNAVDTQPTVNFFAEAGIFQPGSVQVDATGAATVSFIGEPLPVDVTPLVANANQYPIPLASDEPSYTNGALVTNPRDQLVTLVAVTQGEEGFDQDTNTFVDLSDPYIDANDNNVFDTTAGHAETRICTTPFADGGCTPFAGPNGKLDTNTSIWVERHIVFTGTPVLFRSDTYGNTSALPNCLPEGATFQLPLYAYDSYLNEPAINTSFEVIGQSGNVQGSLTLNKVADDNTGSVGYDHSKWGLYNIAESDGGACDATNGAACTPVFLMDGFSAGFGNVLTITNSNSATGGTGGYPDGGPAACIAASVTVNAEAPNAGVGTNTFNFTVQQ